MPIKLGGLKTMEKSPTLSFTKVTTCRTSIGMTKSLEVISEAIRNPKHPFKKVDSQPKKPLKHRYERRKIREYLSLGGGLESSDAA